MKVGLSNISEDGIQLAFENGQVQPGKKRFSRVWLAIDGVDRLKKVSCVFQSTNAVHIDELLDSNFTGLTRTITPSDDKYVTFLINPDTPGDYYYLMRGVDGEPIEPSWCVVSDM